MTRNRVRQIDHVIVVPEPLDPEIERRAALTVRRNLADDAAREVLEMLGLVNA